MSKIEGKLPGINGEIIFYETTTDSGFQGLQIDADAKSLREKSAFSGQTTSAAAVYVEGTKAVYCQILAQKTR